MEIKKWKHSLKTQQIHYSKENFETYHFSRKLSKIKPLLNTLKTKLTISAGSLKERESSDDHSKTYQV